MADQAQVNTPGAETAGLRPVAYGILSDVLSSMLS
jgi:hypothetical protein